MPLFFRHSNLVLLALSAIAITAPLKSAFAQASFQGLGHLGAFSSSRAWGISADGSAVVGTSPYSDVPAQAFRWTAATGMVGLGDLPGGSVNSWGNAISADGSTVVGESISQNGEAYYWTEATGMVGLGDLPGGTFNSWGSGVSANGSTIVGASRSANGIGENGIEAFRWTSTSGMVGLGELPGGDFFSFANGVSGDGSIVVGYGTSANGYEAFRWTESTGMMGLGDLSGGAFDSYAAAISTNGSTIVGSSASANGNEAFRWTESTGIVGLGSLAGSSFSSGAFGVSSDGSTIVGQSNGKAFVWTDFGGMQNLQDLLTLQGANLTGWNLQAATGVSADGTWITGYGSSPSGFAQPFLARLLAAPAAAPEPSALLLFLPLLPVLRLMKR